MILRKAKVTALFLVLACSGILAAQNQGAGPVISSGRINTRGKFSFQYGILEASIKIPKTADGLWPAFWLLGSGYPETPWPDCGEIDLLEMGHRAGIDQKVQDRFFSGAAHWGPAAEDGSHPNYAVHRANRYGLQYGDFHLFTLIWNEGSIKMYLDRDKVPPEPDGSRPLPAPYFEMEITPELAPYFRKPFFIVINLAAGGDLPQIYSIDEVSALSRNSQALYVDFVRVYNQAGALIFDEDFDSATLNSRRWNIEENNDGGGNHELQRYRRRNVTVDKDRASGKRCLILTVKREAS